ncbi:MAG: cytochrome c3 family protein [Caldilineaceae bacterium]
MKPHLVLTPLALLSAVAALFVLVGIAYAAPRPSLTPYIHAYAAATRAPTIPVPTPLVSPPAKVSKAGRIAADHDRYGFSLAQHQTKADGSAFACADCHPNGVKKFDMATCLACHRVMNALSMAQHIADFGENCTACHDGLDRFAPDVFDHNKLNFQLTGRHAQTTCAACHISVRGLDDFKRTRTTCAGCHAVDDVHLGAYGSDCAVCHTTETWQRGPFVHTFPLDHGGQGIVACATCHPDANAKAVYSCYNCHKPTDITRIHTSGRRVEKNIADCIRCHPTGEPTMPMRRGRRSQ